MGTIYELTCDNCKHSQDLSDGCGMGGCVSNYYCVTCGRFKDRWHSVEEMEQGKAAPEVPFCGYHRGQPMKELVFSDEVCGSGPQVPTLVPCKHCKNGTLLGQPSGIWD